MSEAPERIWAWIDYDGNWDGTWLADSETLQPHRLPDAKYIRADLIAAKDAEIERLRQEVSDLEALSDLSSARDNSERREDG